MKKIIVLVFVILLVMPTLVFAKEINLSCDGFKVQLKHNGNGPIHGTISFEEGTWTELFDNGPTGQDLSVLLLNTSTTRLAKIGLNSNKIGLYLQIYANSDDYNKGRAQHSLNCRKMINGE